MSNLSFTPRQVAVSLGVSESSLKRWCDRGLVPFQRTIGGHRRIPMYGLIQFLREQGTAIANPEAVGLPERTVRSLAEPSCSVDQFAQGLVDGDAASARRMVFELYLGGHAIARICDELVQPAFVAIGKRWSTGNVDVYEEHRAFELVAGLLQELRLALPPVSASSPVAMGCSAQGDCYGLPTRMVELTLLELGWNAISLGASVPFESLAKAVEKYAPRLLWLSTSVMADESEFVVGLQGLLQRICTDTAVVVGGRALRRELVAQLDSVTYCANLQCLIEVVAKLW